MSIRHIDDVPFNDSEMLQVLSQLRCIQCFQPMDDERDCIYAVLRDSWEYVWWHLPGQCRYVKQITRYGRKDKE